MTAGAGRFLSDDNFAWSLAALLVFAALAGGAYDLWAATAVYGAVLALTAALILRSAYARAAYLDLGLLLPLALCAGLLGVSTLRAGNPLAAFQGYADWCAAFAVFWIARHAFAGAGGMRALKLTAAALVWTELAVNIAQQLSADHPFREQMWGTLVNANFAACFILLWTPVVFAEAWRRRNSWFWWASTAAALIKLWLTYSVWGLVTLALISPLLAGTAKLEAVFKKHPRRAAVAVFIAAALLVAVVALKFSRVSNWGGADIAGHEYRRFDWWLAALRMFAAEPFFGVGPANYAHAFLAFRTGAGQHSLLAHGLPFTLLSELGLAGTGALLGLAAFWARRVAALGPLMEERRPLVLGLAAFAFAALVLPGVEMLAILLTAAVFAGACLAPERTRSARPRKSVALVAAAAAIVLGMETARPFLAGRQVEAARAALARGRFESALAAGRRGIALYGRSSGAYRMAAQACAGLFRRDGDPARLGEAITLQTRAASLDRYQAVPVFELGQLHLLRGDQDTALLLLRRAAQLDRNNPVIQHGLEDLLGRKT